METTTKKVVHTADNIQDCIDFITEYRRLEKMPYQHARYYWLDVFKGLPQSTILHICDQWRWKKKNFAGWFLNLDVVNRIKVYNSFDITDPYDPIFILRVSENRMATLFENSSNTYQRLGNILQFFYNHGINERCTEYLTLTNTPVFKGKSFDEKDPCYGNSKNWGNYILSLPYQEQVRVVETILNNYQTNRYADLTNKV